VEFTRGGPGFVVVLEGVCRLRLSGMAEDTVLRRNDFAVVTRPAGVVLRDRPDSRLTNGDHLLNGDAAAWRDGVSLGGGGAVSRLAWGNFGVGDDYTRQAFSLLPPLLLACGDGPDASGVGPLVRVLLDEAEGQRPGGDVLANRMLHSLLVYALRATPLTLPGSDDLVPALNVPGMGMALAAMHSRPDHEWSVRELAELAGLSRSKFAVRFVEVFGCPPFDYLRDVRMQLASQLLKETEQGIKEICARVGYATEASFRQGWSSSSLSRTGRRRGVNRRASRTQSAQFPSPSGRGSG
jgi:AraC-like DNA-binding protein